MSTRSLRANLPPNKTFLQVLVPVTDGRDLTDGQDLTDGLARIWPAFRCLGESWVDTLLNEYRPKPRT